MLSLLLVQYRVGRKKRNQILMAEKNTAFSFDLLKIIL